MVKEYTAEEYGLGKRVPRARMEASRGRWRVVTGVLGVMLLGAVVFAATVAAHWAVAAMA